MTLSGRRGRYGIDAPYAPAGMLTGAACCAVAALFAHVRPLWATVVILLVLATVYLHTTLRGKFVIWRKLLRDAQFHGDERVLDLGCGRGAVLLMAAEYLPNGRAVGVDIWSTKDQSGNAADMTRANAVAEGVAKRVELHTADMRELPFGDCSFDTVVSNVAIHNIGDRVGRDEAIDEAWRVLRPGGRLLIADIARSTQYCRRLESKGVKVTRRNLGWCMWWGGPWAPTYLVEARKPPTP